MFVVEGFESFQVHQHKTLQNIDLRKDVGASTSWERSGGVHLESKLAQIWTPGARSEQSQLFFILGNEKMSVSKGDATVRQRLDLDRCGILREFVHFLKDQISLLVDHIFRNRQDRSRRGIIFQQLNSHELSKPI